MRARLLDAVLDLYQPGRGGAHLVIDDVIQTAGVSRGTFYKYFESLEEAVDELGERMAAGTIADFRRLFDNEPNAAARAVGGAAMAMVRAWHGPDRKRVGKGKRVQVRVELGGRRIYRKTKRLKKRDKNSNA